jgi:uncharacterized repeat protein (TIGR03803 family)
MNMQRGQTRIIHSILCMALALALLLLAAPRNAQAQTVTPIYTFVGSSNSVMPHGVVAQGRDGDYYGVTEGPEPGTIYKVSGSGAFTLLHSMAQSDGQTCNGLVLGTDGNFYGTCFNGGNNANSTGTFFRVTPSGTLTVLHNFDGLSSGTTDGCNPQGLPVQASDGNFYGTAKGCGMYNGGMAYKITTAGVFTPIHPFAGGSDAQNPTGALIQGSDGNLWGTSYAGGTTGSGTVFKMTTAGHVTVLHQFNNGCGLGTLGCNPEAGLVQGTDGNFYGTALSGGTNNQGVVFKITPGGGYTVLHNFNLTSDNGAYPQLPLTLGTDGNFYGIGSGCVGGGCSNADMFKITSTGTFTDLYNFTNFGGNNNSLPFTPLLLGTDGTFYSTTEEGGKGAGTVFSLADGQSAFIALQEISGIVGTQVGILGQGFSSSSVVKFNGVTAKFALTGTTFLMATVPAGASTGLVTVTTGTTTLTSRQKFTVHNAWSSGKAIPTAVAAAASGFINSKIYVAGGYTAQGGAPVSNTQIYNPTTNTWTTGAAMPTPVYGAGSAVLSGLLYVIGGYEGSSGTPTNLVQIYNPSKNTWATGTAMLTARGSVATGVDGTAIYVIGGNGSTLRLKNVEKYVPSTNTWTEEAPLLVGKSEPTAALLGSSIVASDGYTLSGDTGDNESYAVSTNTWKSLTPDPNPRNASCYGVVTGQVYVAGGLNNSSPQATTKVNETFSASTNKWTTLATMPKAALLQAPAVGNGVLYCIGGQSSFQGAVISNVQIYQP